MQGLALSELKIGPCESRAEEQEGDAPAEGTTTMVGTDAGLVVASRLAQIPPHLGEAHMRVQINRQLPRVGLYGDGHPRKNHQLWEGKPKKTTSGNVTDSARRAVLRKGLAQWEGTPKKTTSGNVTDSARRAVL